MDQETRAYLNRIEDKVDKLGEEVSETKETVAYLKGRMENGKKNGNDIAVKYLGEGFKVLIAALLAALGIKFLN